MVVVGTGGLSFSAEAISPSSPSLRSSFGFPAAVVPVACLLSVEGIRLLHTSDAGQGEKKNR